MATLSFIQ